MFIVVQNPLFLSFVFLGVAAFMALAWRRLDLALAMVLFLTPLYLLKIFFSWLPLTVLELLILALIFVWLLKKAQEGFDLCVFRELKFWCFWWPVLLLVGGATLGAIFSIDLKMSAGILKSWILEPLIFGLLVADVIKQKKQFNNLLRALVASAAVVAAISLFYLSAHRLTFDGRLAGFYLSPNHLAMCLAPAFLLAIGFWFEVKKIWQKVFLVSIFCLLLVAVYFTYSYAAWLGILVAAAVLVVAFYRRQIISRKGLYLISFILTLVLFLGIFTQLGSSKLNNLLHSERSSWQSRVMVWRAASEILSDNWLVGIGPGMFQKYYLDYQPQFPPYLEWVVPQPHNLFLAWWLQAGLLGLVGFIWLIVNFFRWVLGTIKKQKPFQANAWKGRPPIVLALMAAMIYILIHGLLDATYWKNDLALVFWVIIFLGYRAGRRRD